MAASSRRLRAFCRSAAVMRLNSPMLEKPPLNLLGGRGNPDVGGQQGREPPWRKTAPHCLARAALALPHQRKAIAAAQEQEGDVVANVLKANLDGGREPVVSKVNMAPGMRLIKAWRRRKGQKGQGRNGLQEEGQSFSVVNERLEHVDRIGDEGFHHAGIGILARGVEILVHALNHHCPKRA